MVTGLRLLPFGDRGVLVELGSLTDVLTVQARLTADVPDGVIDVVPAARTVLVHVNPRVLPLAAARAWIERASGAPVAAGARSVDEVVVPIRYDGDDLAETARMLETSPDALVAAHAGAVWTVAFTGFAPGFGYLVSEQWPFDVPRLSSPRTRVPAGAVGLAGVFSGAYPRETPGGWRLIGRTDAPLFDPAAATPVLLTPGATVRFALERARAAVAVGVEAAASAHVTPADAAFTVVEPGLFATVQDQGRPGHAAEGVAGGGAADRGALRTANRLLGNDEDAAGVEVTLGGFRAVADVDLWVAVTGAWGPVEIDGARVDPYAAHPWPAGSALHVDWFAHGARAYVAVRGGVAAAELFGSRSTDTLAGLGPRALQAGDRLGRADAARAPIPPEDLHPWSPVVDDPVVFELAPGPRAGWFDAEAHRVLYEATWVVTAQADRVGIRLDGPALTRAVSMELPSEGMLPGAVQVPPGGEPVVFGPDAPVTGGYPVIAVVVDRDRLGQLRPGARVRFRHARARPDR
ncbi:5-oxoprolinase/urea amidolyase family protein [Microbacterium sp.]|uniref:5-oxoprolinase subunit B/C family protein n=1 Tax=Microbacterium sp. TaxID=51671 RepID=UPI003A835575